MIRCHVGGGLSLFSQNGIFATKAVGFRGCNSSFYLFMGSLSGFCFSFQPLLFCISNHSLKISASDAFEVIQKRHRACLLNFWNIFRREIYNGVMENWSVEIRHDYKGGIILQASNQSSVPLTRRSHNMKQKTLLLLAQNPLDFETYRNRANGWLMSQAPTDGNTERWSKPRAVCLAATMKVVV